MRLLLDTHAFLWFIMGDPKLSRQARTLIEDLNNERLLSMASLWEMAIKVSIGKMQLAEPFEILIPRELQGSTTNVLNITQEHVARLIGLPFHHKDPFDRLLVTQCQADGLPIVSHDQVLDQYSINRLW